MKITDQFQIEGRGLVFVCRLEVEDPIPKRGSFVVAAHEELVGTWEIMEVECFRSDFAGNESKNIGLLVKRGKIPSEVDTIIQATFVPPASVVKINRPSNEWKTPDIKTGGEMEWKYEPCAGRGYECIEVLSFLNGRPIDDVVKGYIQSLRPSSVRVVRGGRHMDAHNWRVTIVLNDDDTIKSIEQEVEVGLYGDIRNGHELSCTLRGIKPLKPGADGNYSVCNLEALKRVKFA